MTEVQTTGRAKSRASLIGILATFFVPLILAIVMFFNLDAWRHPERSNYGELMLPIQPLPEFSAVSSDGQPVGLEFFERTWSLVYVAEGKCDIFCETSLFVMRQARLSLGRDISRLQYVYLAADQQALDSIQPLLQRHPRLVVIKASAEGVSGTLSAIDEQPQTNMYLIDPHANRVLRYPSGSSTKGVYSDLHKLLENSRIG